MRWKGAVNAVVNLRRMSSVVPRDEVDSSGVKLTFLLILMYENMAVHKRDENLKKNAIKTDGFQVTRHFRDSIPDP